MTSSIRFKQSSGAWTPPIEDGKLRVKWGGTAWTSAALVRRKQGDVGGGSWYDTGYRGAPGVPQSFAVNAWSFTTVSLKWAAPAAGGTAVASYDIQQTNATGGVIATKNDTASPSANFTVVEDGRYQFYVRSKSTAGLVSSWVGPIKVQIGHAEDGYDAVENRTRSWVSNHLSGGRNRDQQFWVTIPDNVVIKGMHWRNLRTPQSAVVTPGTNREVYFIVYGVDYSTLESTYGTIFSGDNRDHPLNNDGTGTNWGIVPRGTGWSTTNNVTYMLILDDFWCDGVETYQVTVHYVTTAYKSNAYW